MNAFFTIALKTMNIANLYYPNDDMRHFYINAYGNTSIHPDHFKIYNMIYDMYYLVHIDTKKHTFYNAKCKVFKNVLENMFLTEDYKNSFALLFHKIQRNYNAYNRLAYIYKLKKAPLQVTTDLLMNPIDSENTNSILIYQNNSKYLFMLNDLINIIETNISNAPDFFVEVLSPKNPYTNIVFNKSTLYNIYFKNKLNNKRNSSLFHFYFLANFDNAIYTLENEAYIRDFAIKKYVFTTPKCSLYPKVLHMLKRNAYTSKLFIHADFPKDLLVDIMRPFLYYRYLTEFGVEGTAKIKIYKKILYYKLKKFYEFNTKFGRIFYKPMFERRREITFNSHHIPFHLIDIGDVNILPDIQDRYSFNNIIYLYSDANDNLDVNVNVNQLANMFDLNMNEPEEDNLSPYYYYFPSPTTTNTTNTYNDTIDDLYDTDTFDNDSVS